MYGKKRLLNGSFLRMSMSEYAAWYGALVATTLLIWDVIKWVKAGPSIKATVSTGQKLTNDVTVQQNNT